jgi:hypothetical protein
MLKPGMYRNTELARVSGFGVLQAGTPNPSEIASANSPLSHMPSGHDAICMRLPAMTLCHSDHQAMSETAWREVVVTAEAKYTADELKGWQQIAAFLGEPTSIVQRWASEGMPVRRQGRFVSTTAQELNEWMGRESGKPVHVATGNVDLTSDLKRAVSFARRAK